MSGPYWVTNSCKEDKARRLSALFYIIVLLSLISYERKPLHTGEKVLFQIERKYGKLLKLNCGGKHPPFFFFDHTVLLFNRCLEMFCF